MKIFDYLNYIAEILNTNVLNLGIFVLVGLLVTLIIIK